MPRDDLPPLRPRGRHLPHPPGRAHLDRRDDAGRDHARRPGARAHGPLGPCVQEPARRPAAPGGRALGGQPLGRRLPRRRQARPRRRPRPGPPQDPARGVPGALEWLHLGRRLHGAPGRGARGEDEPRLGEAVPAPTPAVDAVRGRPRNGGGGARARPADPDSGRRRPSPPGGRPQPALGPDGGDRRRAGGDHCGDDRSALPAQQGRGPLRRVDARLPHGAAARSADELLQHAQDRRHRAAPPRRAAGARILRPERRRGAHLRDATPGRPGADVLLQLDARPRLPRDRPRLRGPDALLGQAAAADVRQPRGGLRPVLLRADRRDPRASRPSRRSRRRSRCGG